jgi:transglutaminase-like putative cysteine protease
VALRRTALATQRSPSWSVPPDLVRIGLAGGMSVVLAVIASTAFDEIVWALLLPSIVATVIGAGVRRRSLTVRAAAAAAAVVGGASLAGAAEGADGGVIADGFVAGWRMLLTSEWPSPRDPKVVVAIACLTGLVAAATVELAGRRRFHLAPLLSMVIGLTAAMAVAAPRRPSFAMLACLAVGAVAMTMLPTREEARTRVRTLLGERSLPIVLVVLLVAAVASSSVLAWSERADPRLAEPADVTAAVLDPIEEMIALRGSTPPADMFRITDRSTLIGRSLPTRWRMAALSEYDGQRWVPSITLRRIGNRLGLPSPSSPDAPPPIAFDVELLTDDFDLVPLPGRPLTIETDGLDRIETDLGRTVVRVPDSAQTGATIEVTAEVAPRLGTVGTAVVATRQVDEIARTLLEDAQQLAAGGSTVIEQLDRIERSMHDDWNLDDGAPGGQQLALIERFVAERSGTEEQFVTAFVLLARSLGVDARVATGFVVPPDELEAPLSLRSSHATAWPEVLVGDVGWVAYDPTPEQRNDGPIEQPPQPSAQSPAAAQPPIVQPTEQADDDRDESVSTDDGSGRWASVRTWLVRTGAVAGLALLPFALVIGTILSIKAIRRRRRLRHGDPARRIVGAWANATDALIDAGLTIEPAWTDQRIAESAGVTIDGVVHGEVHSLAERATAMTFGNTLLASQIVDDSLASWRAIEAGLRQQMTTWERIRWRLSVRSIRRRTRTPVAG